MKIGETSTPTSEQNITLQCPKLNESNYTTWEIMMETILKAYGLWETLEATEVADEKKMNTTKAMILTTLPEDIQCKLHNTRKRRKYGNQLKYNI
ncbi:S-locus glycoprotein domain, Bulb-type lectin domain, Zinc finger, CCHC-type [Artemisia annua]|uniref:S-locus glycoprotein domain, Bulb-type lectin domain, Zinc finger, CCHC-type n=1 Tax=Artemisia annua TaxID=35608 RepID=A0A2U1PBV2_ARTAN|nr:S-locus glycoprotein domain, Bulb-type lectin domain, Zinc finger, CCHC-type [Artemisia annua]